MGKRRDARGCARARCARARRASSRGPRAANLGTALSKRGRFSKTERERERVSQKVRTGAFLKTTKDRELDAFDSFAKKVSRAKARAESRSSRGSRGAYLPPFDFIESFFFQFQHMYLKGLLLETRKVSQGFELFLFLENFEETFEKVKCVKKPPRSHALTIFRIRTLTESGRRISAARDGSVLAAAPTYDGKKQHRLLGKKVRFLRVGRDW